MKLTTRSLWLVLSCLMLGCAATDPGSGGGALEGGGNGNKPNAPAHFHAESVAGDVTLVWNDTSNNETKFVLERRSSGLSWDLLGELAANVTRYVDDTVGSNVSYDYRLRSANASDQSAWVETSVLVLPGADEPPSTPASPSATALTDTVVRVRWTDTSSNETQFVVYRSMEANGSFDEVGRVAANFRSFEDTGLDPTTTYYYRVAATNLVGTSAPSAIVSATTKSPEDMVPPLSPAWLRARVLTATSVEVYFSDRTNGRFGHRIERRTGTAAFAVVGILPAGTNSLQQTNLVTGRAYDYRVAAFNDAGSSDYVGPVTIAPEQLPPGAPLAPANFAAVVRSTTAAHLTWTDRSGGNAETQVYWKVDAGDYQLLATVDRGVSEYELTGLSQESIYVVYLKAVTSEGSSPSSTELTIVTKPPPATPQNFAGTAEDYKAVKLSWQDVETESGYRLERQEPGGAWVQIVPSGSTPAIAANTVSYEDKTMPTGATVSYRLRAFNAGGNSPYTTVVTVEVPPSPPAAPTGLVATVLSNEAIRLNWQDNADNESGYAVHVRVGTTGDFAQAATLPAGSVTTIVEDLAPSTTYQFQVYALRAPTLSDPSNVAQGRTAASTGAGAPSDLRATPSFTSVVLTWQNTLVNVPVSSTSLNRIQKFVGGVWQAAGTVPYATQTFTVTGLRNNTVYRFRVRSEIPGASPWTEVTATTLQPAPGAPTSLRLVSATATQLTLGWTKGSGVVTSYVLKYRPTSATAFTTLTPAPAATATSAALPALTPGQVYFVSLVAVNVGGTSPEATGTFALLPQAPSNLTVTDITTSGATLHWNDLATNETAYEVRQSVNGAAATVVATLAAGSTQYALTGLTDDKSYRFWVDAKNDSGISPVAGPLPVVLLPAAPVIDAASARSTVTSISFRFQDKSRNELNFSVERRLANGDWAQALVVPRSAVAVNAYLTVNLPGLTELTGYWFRVRARNATGLSEPSAELQITTQPNAPEAPTANAIGFEGIAPPDTGTTAVPIRVDWAPSATGRPATSYDVLVQRPGLATLTFPVDAPATSYVFNVPSSLNVVTVQIVAKNGGGSSPRSTALRAIPRRLAVGAPVGTHVDWSRTPAGTLVAHVQFQHTITDATGAKLLLQVGTGTPAVVASALNPATTEFYFPVPSAQEALPLMFFPVSTTPGPDSARGGGAGFDR